MTHQELKSTDISEYSSIVIDSLWEQAGHSQKIITPPSDDSITPAPENKTKTPPKKVEPPSNGKLKISKIKGLKKIDQGKINTQKEDSPLDKFRKKSATKLNTNGKGSNVIAKKLAENRMKVKSRMDQLKREQTVAPKEESLLDLRNKGLNQLKRKNQQTLNRWKAKVAETYKRWSQAREQYIKRIPQYQEATFDILESHYEKIAPAKLKKPLTKAIKNEYHIIPNALDLPIRDQGKRPTCAAFTGIRAMETLINGKGKELDLSEQYFYWSSKPKCQRFPCARRGSWISNAYASSVNSRQTDIPLDRDCPYRKTPVQGNETQIPLSQQCDRGVAKVEKFRKLYSLDELYTALSNNSPIIAGFKLSPNFYRTKGLVTYQDSFKRGSTDSHAAGHALLLIGHMKLPPKMHNKEGKICFVVANSWGEGWGRGGFGCLTESWVKNYRVSNPFVALDKVRYKE